MKKVTKKNFEMVEIDCNKFGCKVVDDSEGNAVEAACIEFGCDLAGIADGGAQFNATGMAKRFGKRPHDFLVAASTGEYIAALCNADSHYPNQGSENSALYTSVDSGNGNSRFQNSYVRVVKGGKYQGTWMAQVMALEFARWLSPDFRVALDKWIVDQVKRYKDWTAAREWSRLGHRPMTDATVSARAALGKETLSHHHSNEANLVNLVVLGMTAKEYKTLHGVDNIRDALTADQNDLIAKVQKANTAFIECGFDYQFRKEALMRTYSPTLLLK